MGDKYGVKWNREETILAFELYCQTPSSKIGKNNSEIKELASMLGRTPDAVALKMHNLAHYDPAIINANKVAMKNGSKLDKEIVNEFINDWYGLSYEAKTIKAKYLQEDVASLVNVNYSDIPNGSTREQKIKARIGQDFFRNAVLNSYHNKCCITGFAKPELLIASHIKPWSKSDDAKEKVNPCNGLCLNAFHDMAFDKGFITIDKNYRIILASNLNEIDMDEKTRNWFFSYAGSEISLPDKFRPDPLFIEYHNDVIFRG